MALKSAYPEAEILASDADAEMLGLAKSRLGTDGPLYRQGNFSDEPFAERAPFGFIFLDLGISSAHFDYFERGFSFRFEQPLDMRLDTTRGKSAAELLAESDEATLAGIFFDFGEEKLSRRIAREIISQRKAKPIETTGALAEICKRVYPPRYKARGHADRHPATRVFQALRIAVNRELASLDEALARFPRQLCIGGRMAIITFHSLEDRRVKHAFRGYSMVRQEDPLSRSNFLPGDFREIHAGGIVPSAQEVEENPRARSARLRILERVR